MPGLQAKATLTRFRGVDTRETISSTSIRGPITPARACWEVTPQRLMHTAIASSKLTPRGVGGQGRGAWIVEATALSHSEGVSLFWGNEAVSQAEVIEALNSLSRLWEVAIRTHSPSPDHSIGNDPALGRP